MAPQGMGVMGAPAQWVAPAQASEWGNCEQLLGSGLEEYRMGRTASQQHLRVGASHVLE